MFFEAERHSFFRPLSGNRRELVSACLRSLYERLHGPGADYSQTLTRDMLLELIIPVIQTSAESPLPAARIEDDELSSGEYGDDLQLAGALIRSLLRDGWLETFGDRVGLITAYRFTRAGKLFAEAIWALTRPNSRSRQRNVRSCRNSLNAALRNVDAHDLVDAYDYAEKVIGDLAEGVDYFQELVRHLMQEAARQPWDDFMDFLDRFEKEFKKQFTADSVARHRQAIRDAVNKLRSIDADKYRAMESQLADIARWAVQEHTGASTYDWLLDRIEEMVEAACISKQPELVKAMHTYIGRAASIVQQAQLLRSGQTRHAYSRAITQVAALEGTAQVEFLAKVGDAIAAAEVRLLDPLSFRFRTLAQRRKALAVTAKPTVSREARLAAALETAEGSAFSVSNEDVLHFIVSELRLQGRPIRLSTLPLQTATEMLTAMQAVEAVRNTSGNTIKATKLPAPLATSGYSGSDYQIEISK